MSKDTKDLAKALWEVLVDPTYISDESTFEAAHRAMLLMGNDELLPDYLDRIVASVSRLTAAMLDESECFGDDFVGSILPLMSSAEDMTVRDEFAKVVDVISHAKSDKTLSLVECFMHCVIICGQARKLKADSLDTGTNDGRLPSRLIELTALTNYFIVRFGGGDKNYMTLVEKIDKGRGQAAKGGRATRFDNPKSKKWFDEAVGFYGTENVSRIVDHLNKAKDGSERRFGRVAVENELKRRLDDSH